MAIFIKALFFFVLALAFALMEVENEGKFGWSEKSQTWYRMGKDIPQPLRSLMGKKPVTGYHLFLFTGVFLVTHMVFFLGRAWSLTAEIEILTVYLAWTPLWDHLWIIFNPFYKVTDVKKLWWYAKTKLVFGFVPVESAAQWILSIILAVVIGNLINQLVFLGILLLLAVISNFTLAPVFKRWYLTMHASDDRDKSGIFHQ